MPNFQSSGSPSCFITSFYVGRGFVVSVVHGLQIVLCACGSVLWLLSNHDSNFGFQMTTAIAIEDVRREVTILRALTGHNNLVQFYDAYEDNDNVYIVME